MATTTTKHEAADMGWTSYADIDQHIADREAEEGGAFTYDETFGLVFITRADYPSRLPDHLISPSRNRIYFKGGWRNFSQAAIIREQNRGLGRGA